MTDDISKADLLYGVQAIANFLGLSRHQAQHRIDEGVIPTFRLGGGKRGTICARRTTLRAWLAALERAAQASEAGEASRQTGD